MSSTVSAWTVGLSLAVFVSLYTVLGFVDFYLMRRYARVDPGGPPAEGGEQTAAEPAPVY